MSDVTIFCIILTFLVTSLGWMLLLRDYEEEIEQDVHEYNEKVISKKIAGHKSAHTRVKKDKETWKNFARNVVRKGRRDG